MSRKTTKKKESGLEWVKEVVWPTAADELAPFSSLCCEGSEGRCVLPETPALQSHNLIYFSLAAATPFALLLHAFTRERDTPFHWLIDGATVLSRLSDPSCIFEWERQRRCKIMPQNRLQCTYNCHIKDKISHQQIASKFQSTFE